MSGITRRGFVKGAALAPLALTPFNAMARQAAAKPDRFDIVVAGAGHNSLVTAAYLAKAGFRCVVLEGRPTVGGGVKSAQFTLRGFIHDTCSSAHNGIQDNPLIRDKEIDLERLRPRIHHPRSCLPHAFSRRRVHHAVARPGAHPRRICKNQQERRRRLLADVERVRQHSTQREILAAPPGDVVLGRHPHEFRGRSLPHVHAGLPVVAATPAVSDDRARRLWRV